MKKQIKVKFLGFWGGFENENWILELLQKHYDVILSDEPEYLFYSCFCKDAFDYLNYDCIRILFSGENVSPDFNYCDYSIGFDEITYNDRHICFPLFLAYSQLNDGLHKHEGITDETYYSKEHFCNYIYGNSKAMQERTDIFHKLHAYKPVSSCGRYLTNTEPVTRTQETKLAFQNKCRFTIAFESCAQPGFSTEKILHAFAAKTVPIYYGNKDVTHIFNPDSFINCHDLPDLDRVVERVKEVEENPQLWKKMLETPCFIDQNYPAEKWDELEKFLCNIVDQEYEKAFRRPLEFRPKHSQDFIKEYLRLRDLMRRNIIVRFVLKLFKVR